MKTYTEKDFVDVVDEAGEPAGSYPKAWQGTEFWPDGVKPAGKTSSRQSAAEKKAAEEAAAKEKAEAEAKAKAEQEAAEKAAAEAKAKEEAAKAAAAKNSDKTGS